MMNNGQRWCRPVVILAERDKLVMDAELGSILRECKIKVITREGPLSAQFCSSPNHSLCPVAPALQAYAFWQLASPDCIMAAGVKCAVHHKSARNEVTGGRSE